MAAGIYPLNYNITHHTFVVCYNVSTPLIFPTFEKTYQVPWYLVPGTEEYDSNTPGKCISQPAYFCVSTTSLDGYVIIVLTFR